MYILELLVCIFSMNLKSNISSKFVGKVWLFEDCSVENVNIQKNSKS